MFELLKLRIKHGNQVIPDIKKAKIDEKFRGLPLISQDNCKENCAVCRNQCPVNAISLNPISIDIGKCIFCGNCERVCPSKIIKFSNFYKIGATERNSLIINSKKNIQEFQKEAIHTKKRFKKIFNRSLKLREVSAGGCNACEMELNACSNVNFDMSRFGIDFVASPRFADGIVITGPITENMKYALKNTYLNIPEPKIVIAVGACGINGGLFENSPAIDRDFFNSLKVDLFIPGCPVHPLTFINAILDFLDR